MTACGCQRLAMGCLTEDKNSKSKRRHNSKEMHFELSPLTERICLWIVNIYSDFQVNIFNSKRDITKCRSFSKSKKGHNSGKKMHFELSPFDSMDCSLDGEQILGVSSRYH